MEYQFCRDLLGTPDAHFSMGHEALGHWLMTELGTTPHKITQLITTVEALINKEAWHYNMKGQDFHLQLTREQAEVRAILLDDVMDCAPMHYEPTNEEDFSSQDLPNDDMENLAYYDNESSSHCGLDDFKTLLESWLEFISR